MGFINLLFTFNGRVNRAKWWLVVVLWSVVWMVATFALIISSAKDIAQLSTDASGEDALSAILSMGAGLVLLLLVVLVPMAVSGIFVGIKRLHDRDRSGWWLVVFYVVPAILQGIAASFDSTAISFVLNIAAFAIVVWGIVELGFLRGTAGPNQYGPDPLAPA